MSSRRSRYAISLFLCLTPTAAVPSQAGALEGNCRVANQPSATLLIPYFEVDLADMSGQTTLVSINNASVKPALARVVLWTDWGVPTLAFDIYLTGYDVQTLNLRDLFQGALPVTGPEVKSAGSLSNPNVLFTGCGNSGTAGITAPLSATELAWLRAAHTGQPVSTASQCAGSGSAGPHVAIGYMTVDAVNRCTPRTVGTTDNTPAQAAYFTKGGAGLASDANVLWGEYYYINSQRNTSDSQTAISILADTDFFAGGDYTFYGRYSGFDSRDDRAPLSSLYYTRYIDGGPFSGGTDLIVWRDNRKSAATLHACGKPPDWAPLGEMQFVIFDEEENPREIVAANVFPLVTQKIHVGGPTLPVPQPFGWMMIDLWHKDSTHAQAWVSVIMTAEGRFSVGREALRADDLCNFGP
ncbi:MAG TPA: hypothetical protein VGG03_03070 [Thermoanaerobaculia bacterium]|jgi:hypothetical protein